MSSGTSKSKRTMQLSAVFIALAGLVAGLTAFASAQTTVSLFFSGTIPDADFCVNRSLGGPVAYPHDKDRDGVAEVCSLPRTRRETAARQNAMERLGGQYAFQFGRLFAEECLNVRETYGEPGDEAEDECAAPRAALADGRTLPTVPQQPIPLENNSDLFFSGPVVTSRIFCLDHSFGGPVTYPLDVDRDGVADICSLPRTRRAAIARQNAFERLASLHGPEFNLLVAEECLRVPGSFGEPEDEAKDFCATGRSPSTDTTTGTTGGTTTGTTDSTTNTGTDSTTGTDQNRITPPTAPVATNPGVYNKRSAQDMVLAPGTRSITVGWDPVTADDNPDDTNSDPYDANSVFEYIVEYSTNRNMSGSSRIVNILNRAPAACTGTTPAAATLSSEYACTISGLTDLTTYYVRIQANRGPGKSNPYTPILSITPGLAGPVIWPEDDPDTANVDEGPLTSSLYGQINVRWTAPYGIAVNYYIIQWGTTNRLPESCIGASNCEQTSLANTATTHTITGLNNNTIYYVRLQGVTNNGPGTWSTTQSLRLTSNLQTPGTPTSLMLTTAGTGNTLQATWTAPVVTANDPAPTHYLIQWRNITARENWSGSTRQTSVQAPTLTAAIASLAAGNEYEVRVQAVNSQVAGGWSRTERIVLGQAAAPTVTSVVPGNRQLTVNWTEPTSVPQVQSYNLQYSTSGSFPSNCQTSSSCTQVGLARGTTTHLITGLQDNRIYYIRMQSINANGPGAFSTVSSGEPGTPIAPTGLSAAEDADNIRNLDLTWSYSDEIGKPDLTRFRLQWRTEGSTNWNSRYLSLTQSGCPTDATGYPYCSGGYSYTLGALSTGNAYEVRVQASNSYGDGEPSASATATPGASFIPSDVAIAASGSGTTLAITATWSAPSSSLTVNSYTVQWRTCGTSGYSCGGWTNTRSTSDATVVTLANPSSPRSGIYYQARVRANGAGTSGGAGAYAESSRYRADIDNNETPSDRTDDTITVTELATS